MDGVKEAIIGYIAKKLKRCLGIVEDTNTATHAISAGKFVVWKDVMCKATEAISIGDTLSSGSGGNLTIVDNGALNDVNGNLGSPSSASSVTGDDAFSKINTLNGNIASIRKLKYMDLTDTTPMNVNNESSSSISIDNFVGCASSTSGAMPLPYYNNGVLYIKLVNYSDLSSFSGSATVRVWYV